MKKILRTIAFWIMLVVYVLFVYYLFLPDEQRDKGVGPQQEVSQVVTAVEQSDPEDSQRASAERVALLSPSSAEQLRQEAEQRFEKLTRIENESGKPVEREEGLRVHIEVPSTPAEPAQAD